MYNARVYERARVCARVVCVCACVCVRMVRALFRHRRRHRRIPGSGAENPANGVASRYCRLLSRRRVIFRPRRPQILYLSLERAGVDMTDIVLPGACPCVITQSIKTPNPGRARPRRPRDRAKILHVLCYDKNASVAYTWRTCVRPATGPGAQIESSVLDFWQFFVFFFDPDYVGPVVVQRVCDPAEQPFFQRLPTEFQ